MPLRRLLPTNRKAKADRRSSLEPENDKPTTSTSTGNVTTTPTHRMRARNADESVLPVVSESGRDETESLITTDTLGLATARYSKRLSVKFKFSPTSYLCEFC